MPEFVPGLRLSELFYREAARPILDARFPGLRHSAALLGPGSEVLGYDTPQSTDHDWGPRLQLVLGAEDYARRAADIGRALGEDLPHSFRGYPTGFGPPDALGVKLLEATTSGPVHHRVEVHTLDTLSRRYLGVAPDREPDLLDWLTLPQQRLLEFTGGAVFHDGLGTLESARARFAFYPRDVWLYLLAAGWTRVGQEEAFMARCGDVGDDLGSRIVAARLARDLMRLCFLIERRYAPYTKWFGTAFARLSCAPQLAPVFDRLWLATDWREREGQLARAYGIVAGMHNALGVTGPLNGSARPFHSRPYLVLGADRFAAALRDAIADGAARRLIGARGGIGAVDQFIDSTTVLTDRELCDRLRALYER